MKTKNIVGIGLFTAIVIVLQLVASGIKLGPFSISLVLVPIVVGAAVYGWKAGAWLGFVFGAAVLLSGDAAAFLAVSIPGTIIVVLVKGILSGLAAGIVYKLLEKANKILAATTAAVTCPIVNTGVFLLGCLVFFMETITGWGAAMGFENVGAYMIFGLTGANFLLELAINLVLVPVITRLIRVGKQ